MAVTRDDVLHVAGLARLRLDVGEAESLTADLDEILEHMEALAAVAGAPDDGVGPATPPREESAPSRGDGEAEPDRLVRPPSELAPEWGDGFFLVPRLPGMSGEGEPTEEA